MKGSLKSHNRTIWKLLQRLIKSISFIFVSAILMISIILSGQASSNALSDEANGDNPLKIVIQPSEDMVNVDNEKGKAPKLEPKANSQPDLGDDQVFPFAAGLDSY